MSVIEHQGGAITGRLLRARRVVRITRPLKPLQLPPALSQPHCLHHTPKPPWVTRIAGAVTGRLAGVGWQTAY